MFCVRNNTFVHQQILFYKDRVFLVFINTFLFPPKLLFQQKLTFCPNVILFVRKSFYFFLSGHVGKFVSRILIFWAKHVRDKSLFWVKTCYFFVRNVPWSENRFFWVFWSLENPPTTTSQQLLNLARPPSPSRPGKNTPVGETPPSDFATLTHTNWGLLSAGQHMDVR